MEQQQPIDPVLVLCQQAASDLKEFGHAVIPSILSEAQCTALEKNLEDTLVGVAGKNRKWRDVLPCQKGILLEPKELNHCDASWEARKACLPYFARLFGTGDLWCSFDRMNVMHRSTPPKEWLHTDQSGYCSGFHCVQGYLDVKGTRENDAGLRVAEGSHLKHEVLLQEWTNAMRKSHWYLLKKDEAEYMRKTFLMKKVLCPPGSLVLWDSRTFHENQVGSAGGHDRLVFYVCMLPHSFVKSAGDRRYQKLKELKQKHFTYRQSTSHWPTLMKVSDFKLPGDKSRFIVDNKVIRQPSIETDPVVAALAGFSDTPALDYEGPVLMEVEFPEVLYRYES